MASKPATIGNRPIHEPVPGSTTPLRWHNTDSVVRSDGRNSGYHYPGSTWDGMQSENAIDRGDSIQAWRRDVPPPRSTSRTYR